MLAFLNMCEVAYVRVSRCLLSHDPCLSCVRFDVALFRCMVHECVVPEVPRGLNDGFMALYFLGYMWYVHTM